MNFFLFAVIRIYLNRIVHLEVGELAGTAPSDVEEEAVEVVVSFFCKYFYIHS